MDKNIFIYWHDTKTIPMFVSKCIKQCQDMHPDYNIVIYDEMSIKEELKEDKEFLSLLLDHKLANEHKSDLIRLGLLEKYGGEDAFININDHSYMNINMDMSIDIKLMKHFKFSKQ